MRITICCVGKVKEKFYCQAIDEYSKRLSRYCKLEVKEVADEKTPDNASDTVNDIIKAKEGERLLSCIKDESYTFDCNGVMKTLANNGCLQIQKNTGKVVSPTFPKFTNGYKVNII